jgi:hypothetical protein
MFFLLTAHFCSSLCFAAASIGMHGVERKLHISFKDSMIQDKPGVCTVDKRSGDGSHLHPTESSAASPYLST